MRSWGGKIIVGLLGMLVGGPIGLIVGVLVGHFLDRGVERVRTFNPFRPYAPARSKPCRTPCSRRCFRSWAIWPRRTAASASRKSARPRR